MEQYGIHVKQGDLLFAAPSIGTTVNITGTITWSGVTDASGMVTVSLPYGSYTITASKSGYNSAQQNFAVPLVGDINLTITQILQSITIIVSE